MTFWLLFLHIIGASIWVGGHLILSIRYLPNAVLKKEIGPLTQFEEKFEVVGIPALLIQVVTGIIMAINMMPISNWCPAFLLVRLLTQTFRGCFNSETLSRI